MLHLFANYKWTGPADPAIRCAARLQELGVDVVFAQAAWTHPGGEHRIAEELSKAGLPVLAGLGLRKHFRPIGLLRDVRRLARRLAEERFDVVHTHLLADHLTAALALRRVPDPPLIVRTLYDPKPPRHGWRERLAFAGTAGVVAPTRAVGEAMARRFGSLGRLRVLLQEPPIELRSRTGRNAGRQALGLAPEDFVVGITARVQPHRRFDLLWEVARRVVDRAPWARFVLLGRGNERDVRRLVLDPVRRLGLEEYVRLPGYLREPAYGEAIAAFDAFLFLVPGSDGTCRAVREAMAAGLPVVATRRGILPELCAEHPDTPGAGAPGAACPEDAGSLADALLRLIEDPDRRATFAAAARQRAAGPMDPARAARRLLEFYTDLRAERTS